MLSKKKGQVWIETVTYTLVAFVLIGLILAFAKPKIDKLQDQSIIEQSMKMIKEMHHIGRIGIHPYRQDALNYAKNT